MKFSFRTCPVQYRNAILHVVGQMEDMSQIVSTGDIAACFGVSKPTAQKYLKNLCNEGWLNQVNVTWRPNADKFIWQLTSISKFEYREKRYQHSYLAFLDNKYGSVA